MHPLSFKDSFVFKSAEAGNTPTSPHVTVHGLVLHKLLHEKAVVFQLNLKYLHVKISNRLLVVV